MDNQDQTSQKQKQKLRPFVIFSISGDQFLLGQVRGVIGLFIAIIKGYIDPEIIDCMFDEEYTNLVPAPFAPSRGLYAGAATYMTWEGKTNMILNPRSCDRHPHGWNDSKVLQRVEHWSQQLYQYIGERWYLEGVLDGNGNGNGNRLMADKLWEAQVLAPWAEKARLQLEDYRTWKASMAAMSSTSATPTATAKTLSSSLSSSLSLNPTFTANDVRHSNQLKDKGKDKDKDRDRDNHNEDAQGADDGQLKQIHTIDDSQALDMVPPLTSIDPSVPELYEKVLYYLREANSGGLWPSTTLKRQLVMSSTSKDESAADTNDHHSNNNNKNNNSSNNNTNTGKASLSMAFSRARKNKDGRTSAYSFVEGQGGASGSFSVGGMPGNQCEQPKGNTLFPELMKAAFELEIALCPNREPSSTIAINRNAQFRPHTGEMIRCHIVNVTIDLFYD